MLKPSIKSVEGQSFFTVVIGCLGLLYFLITGNSLDNIPIEELLKHAKTVQDIKDAYSTTVGFGGVWDTAKITAVLAFIYKMYGRFVDGRVDLKGREIDAKKEIELKRAKEVKSE